jgi:hypothetical protein
VLQLLQVLQVLWVLQVQVLGLQLLLNHPLLRQQKNMQ